MNALAKAKVGDYINDHFVLSHQKVGTFQKIGQQKVGGNVACYFCKPDCSVIHAIPGPVDEATFSTESPLRRGLRNSASFLSTAGNYTKQNATQQKTASTKAVKQGFADRVAPANTRVKAKGAGRGQSAAVTGQISRSAQPRDFFALLCVFGLRRAHGTRLARVANNDPLQSLDRFGDELAHLRIGLRVRPAP